jgi:deoxyribose-phosphate aldolase
VVCFMELDQLIEKVTAELMKEFKREPQDLQESQPPHTPQDLQGLQSSPASQTACASQEIARFIDHTLLKPDSTREQIIRFCEEAKEYCFASVCVNPTNVSLASNLLKDTPVKVCTVIGFPLGANTSVTKAIETRDAIVNGASEVDMVINVGALKSGDHNQVLADIEAVVDAAGGKALVKVILETALLTDEEKVKGCLLAKLAGADFVKTSTGFGPGGATVEDIRLMRKTVGPDMGVKAAGGIRDYESMIRMIHAGATRIGASAGTKIVKQAKESEFR